MIDAEKMPEIVEQLIKDDILFKYATAYELKNQESKPLFEFITEFEDLKFVKHPDLNSKLVLTGALEAFKAKAMDHPQWNATKKDFDDLT
ncbi:MAG: hypothetical protein IPP42_01035 [Saprospiraceae bacterium]|nr:hypothetical protein [Saprospiraceae bacterium]